MTRKFVYKSDKKKSINIYQKQKKKKLKNEK